MRIPIFQIDAFTDTLFQGNPAAVCPIEDWLEDAVMQSLAAENNLSETAFCVPRGDHYELRWFTPTQEVPLCGHATLAAAYVILTHLEPDVQEVIFSTQSGFLTVQREDPLFWMDFPSYRPQPAPVPDLIHQVLGISPVAFLQAQYDMAVLDSEATVRQVQPQLELLLQSPKPLIITAAGQQCDFVSRFFAPQAGVPEDPVTGSAHCSLIPYWSQQLNRSTLQARQVSARGGSLVGQDHGDRVRIGGQAVQYLAGTVQLS